MAESEHVNLDKQPGGRGNCISCGVLTKWACPFCRVYEGKIVWLCERPGCREHHEEAEDSVPRCVRTRRREAQHGE